MAIFLKHHWLFTQLSRIYNILGNKFFHKFVTDWDRGGATRHGDEENEGDRGRVDPGVERGVRVPAFGA